MIIGFNNAPISASRYAPSGNRFKVPWFKCRKNTYSIVEGRIHRFSFQIEDFFLTYQFTVFKDVIQIQHMTCEVSGNEMVYYKGGAPVVLNKEKILI